MTYFWAAVIAFCVGFLYDVLYIGFVRGVVDNRPWKATFFSMATGACGASGFISLADKRWWAAAFLVLGYGAGTLVVMKWKARHG